MNVTCPQCATVFRVDPAKIPARGIRARCSTCAGIIPIQPQASPPPPPPPAPTLVAEFPTAEAVTPSPPPAPPPPPPPAVAPPPRVEPPAPERSTPLPPPAVPFTTLPEREEPVVSAAPAAPPPTPPPSPVASPAGGFSNPFLQQDPSTRARRLARALVSDLVVYHPEKRQRGLDEGNLKDLFAEEIRKSWEEYTEQVGEELARTTPYFTDALNEILAEGQALFG